MINDEKQLNAIKMITPYFISCAIVFIIDVFYSQITGYKPSIKEQIILLIGIVLGIATTQLVYYWSKK